METVRFGVETTSPGGNIDIYKPNIFMEVSHD